MRAAFHSIRELRRAHAPTGDRISDEIGVLEDNLACIAHAEVRAIAAFLARATVALKQPLGAEPSDTIEPVKLPEAR